MSVIVRKHRNPMWLNLSECINSRCLELIKFCLNAGLMFSLSSCSFEKTSQWYNPPPDSVKFFDTIHIEHYDINDANIHKADSALENNDYIALSPAEFSRYTGRQFNSEKTPILVRTTTISYDSSGYSFYKGPNNQILIRHLSLSSSSHPPQSSPLIMLIDTIPSKIWNSCSAIE